MTATPVNGGQWVYGSRITYSFVPDGTSVGGISSTLNSTLSSTYGASWQLAIEKAAALWSSYANINLAMVSDNGAPTGSAGYQQGDSRFGDIRFAMIPQSGSVLAFAMLPPPINGGTNAGDIVFNSNVTYSNAGYDLTTVAIHEFGHALGLDHSPVANDVMYAYYNGQNQVVSASDGAALTGLYGAYPADSTDNSTASTATPISLGSNGTATLSNESLAGSSDVDWYSVIAPANTNGTLTVSMQTTGLSTASPRVILYASNGTTGLSQAQAPNVYGATVTTTTSATAGTKYYIKALPASSLGSYGNYGLLVSFTSSTPTPVTPPVTTVAAQQDQGGSSMADTDGNGQTLLQRVVADLNQAIGQLQTNGHVSLGLVLTSLPDLLQMVTGLVSDTTLNTLDNGLVTDAKNLLTSYFIGLPSLELTASQNFLQNVVQAGTITTYGDDLTVNEYRSSEKTLTFPDPTHTLINPQDYRINVTAASTSSTTTSTQPVVFLLPKDADVALIRAYDRRQRSGQSEFAGAPAISLASSNRHPRGAHYSGLKKHQGGHEAEGATQFLEAASSESHASISSFDFSSSKTTRRNA